MLLEPYNRRFRIEFWIFKYLRSQSNRQKLASRGRILETRDESNYLNIQTDIQGIIKEKYAHLETVYTDGSRNGAEGGVRKRQIRVEVLVSEASVYTAEFYATKLALNIAKENAQKHFILCDALDVLQNIRGV